MTRLGALVLKELRQHAVAVVGAIALLVPIVGLMILGAAVNPQNLSYFEALRSGLLLFVPIVGLVLGNRLVVAEYYGRTQLFLEALPIRRWEMVLVKYVLGMAVMIGATLTLLVVVATFAAFDEPLDPRFLAILAGRALGFVAALWGFLFMMGFTGRFRLAIYVALVIALVAAGELTDLEVARFGPLRLIDSTMPYERVELPTRALFESLSLAVGFAFMAFVLSSIGDGSVAEALAKRMSTREKSAVGATLLVALITYSTVLEERREPDPYELPAGTDVVEGPGSRVQVTLLDEGDRPAAALLLEQVEADVSSLSTRLGWDEVPRVRVALRATLDGDTFEPVRLARGDGVLLRANYTADDVDVLGLRSAILVATIDAYTNGRATFEPQRCFLEGYARHLVEGSSEDSERVTLRRAIYATSEAPLAPSHLVAWNRTREAWGPAIAEGVAAAVVRTIRDSGEDGEERVHALARALFGEPSGDHSWVTVRAKLHPYSQLLEVHTDLTTETLTALTNEALDSLRSAPWAAPVLALPPLSAGVVVEPIEGRLRAITARVSQPTPRDEATVATLVHHRLEPLDGLIPELELERDEVAWAMGARSAELRLEGRYGPGERAFVAVEVDSPTLGCPIRFAAARRTIR